MAMKYSTQSFAAALAFLLPLPFLPAEPLSSEITALRLYRDGGEVVRRVVADPPPDGTSLRIDRLPSATDERSLQVTVLSDGAPRLAAIRFERLEEGRLPVSEAVRELEREIRSVRQALEDLDRRLDQAGARVSLLAEIRQAYLQGLAAEADFSATDRLLELQEDEQVARGQQIALERELRDERLELSTELKELERRLGELRQREAALNGRLTLDFLEALREPVELEIRSRVSGIGWSPFYRFEARPAEKRLVLDYLARIRNGTGEAWDQVPATLLTGQPGWRMEAPELPPVYLRKPPEPRAELARAKADMALQSVAFSAAPSSEPEVERLSTQFELDLPNPVTVDPFESDRQVELTQVGLKADYHSTVAPALDETAFLHGEANLDLPWPLLPGEATILVDGAISGRTRIGFVNPGQPIELGFGENPAIEVDYTVMDIEDRDAGIIDRVRRYQRHYRSTVYNRMPVAHSVEVRGRFPVSRDEAIEVRRIEPEEVEVDPETGRFVRRQTLESGAEANFTTRFEVTAPRDWKLSGNF
jgi:uncharacterized protein (TIGR02231 family)